MNKSKLFINETHKKKMFNTPFKDDELDVFRLNEEEPELDLTSEILKQIGRKKDGKDKTNLYSKCTC